MTYVFQEDGVTVEVTNTGLLITPNGGNTIETIVPNFASSGINPSDPQWHQYVVVNEIGSTAEIPNIDMIWRNVLEEPAPTFGKWPSDTQVQDGALSVASFYWADALGPNIVKHHINTSA